MTRRELVVINTVDDIGGDFMEVLMNDQVIRGESFERESTFHQEGSMHGDRNHFDANMVEVDVEAEVDVHRMQQAEINVEQIHQVDSNVDEQADNKRVDEVKVNHEQIEVEVDLREINVENVEADSDVDVENTQGNARQHEEVDAKNNLRGNVEVDTNIHDDVEEIEEQHVEVG